MPCRFTILHLEQRFLMDAVTFMVLSLRYSTYQTKVTIITALRLIVQFSCQPWPNLPWPSTIVQKSQDQGTIERYGNRMLKVGGQ